MLDLAIRNLLVRKTRTALATAGLTIALMGIVALVSLSSGVEALLKETLRLIPGLMVLEKDVASPVLSSVPRAERSKLDGLPGVRAVIPQIFFPAFKVEGKRLLTSGDPFAVFLVLGIDPDDLKGVEGGGLFARSLKRGRPIRKGTKEVMLSLDAVARFGKDVGQKLKLHDEELDVVGVFQVGSMLLDRGLVVDLDFARAMRSMPAEKVSCFYVELEEGADSAVIEKAIEKDMPTAWVRTTEETTQDFNGIWQSVDIMLAAIAAISVLVGAVGIVNTMLMSVMERTGELGILRAVGWRRRDIVRLILIESALLGIAGGVIGCAMGSLGVALAAQLSPLKPVVSGQLVAGCMGLAVLLGAAGGLYPALHAARLDPIEAIRT